MQDDAGAAKHTLAELIESYNAGGQNFKMGRLARALASHRIGLYKLSRLSCGTKPLRVADGRQKPESCRRWKS